MKRKSFEEFWEDVKKLTERKRRFCTVGQQMINIVEQVKEDEILVKSERGNKPIAPVPKRMFRTTYDILRQQRLASQKVLMGTVKRSAFVTAVLAHLPYFRVCTSPVTIEVKKGYEFY